ncbi:hypothetical protein ATO13_22646 [Stappia sp. 22II-S9-Z10]|nr:hypothetical protein ATO13_22646 [Stappia sp. 22II-S9-Z10]
MIEVTRQRIVVGGVAHIQVTEIATDQPSGLKLREFRFYADAEATDELLIVRAVAVAADADLDGEGISVTVPSGIQF